MSEGKWLNATAGDEKETRRASRRKKEQKPKGGMERQRSRRWMLINYEPSESESSPFRSGAGAAESHGGSY